MTDEQRGDWYEPDADGLCDGYELKRNCSQCCHLIPKFSLDEMTAREFIEYRVKTKGKSLTCLFGRIGVLFACSDADMRWNTDRNGSPYYGEIS